MLDVESGEVGAPELVQGQRAGAGVPQPHGPVRVAAVGQAPGGDVDEGAAQDRQALPAGEPAAVAVDEVASELPQAVDGPEARAWIAEHDVIDHGLLGKVLAGLPADDAAQVRDACARWARLRFAAGATAYPRPDAWCSPGREHVHNGACHCQGSSKTAPGWEYQLTAAIGHLRTAWAALADVGSGRPRPRTPPDPARPRALTARPVRFPGPFAAPEPGRGRVGSTAVSFLVMWDVW